MTQENTVLTLAQKAVRASVAKGEIIGVLDGIGVMSGLKDLCDDWVDTNAGRVEFWGTHDGAEWRVHVKTGGAR